MLVNTHHLNALAIKLCMTASYPLLKIIASLKFVVFAIFCSFASLVLANGKSANNQFLDLSLQELMNIKVVNVSSVSRHSQKLTEVASAVFVITQDDIRRSGATSIPDALRMAPGVQVERIGTDKWAVSIRGFNGFSADKVQVLIDGRSDYSPLIAGTLWAQQDTLMEDIERIEIIRGPAATVWGTNAVNGVINVITKNAASTQGALLTAGGGSFEHGFGSARYGGKINEDTPFRIYAKGFSRDNTVSLSGGNAHDQWHSVRGGFRLDHARGIDQFTLQGEGFFNATGNTTSQNYPISNPIQIGTQEGGYMRFRWDRVFSDQSSLMFQAAYDRNHFRLLPIMEYKAESVDIDFQHRFPLFDKHNLIWGGHYRANHNKVINTEIMQFNPQERTNHFFSGFIRDEVALIPKHLLFSLGTRVDHNDFTGLEIQPSTRLTWVPNSQNSVWIAISRAVRTPSRTEQDARVTYGNLTNLLGMSNLPVSIHGILQGINSFDSEKLLAYELGYRHQFSSRASIDIAGFVNDYSNLRDFSFGALALSSGLPQQLILPIFPNNKAAALTYGFEVAADWKPLEKWRLQGNYSYLNIHTSLSNELFRNFDPTSGGASKVNPQHQLSFRSNYDITEKLELNLWLRYTSNISFYNIPSYAAMDAKLIWKPMRNVELFAVGQNLLSGSHREFEADTLSSVSTLIPRGVYVGAQWRF
ncbi:MAG: TonB-dependent receptor [Nitrosomonas sp.]|jgi:iron complex outermembrane recepter protein